VPIGSELACAVDRAIQSELAILGLLEREPRESHEHSGMAGTIEKLALLAQEHSAALQARRRFLSGEEGKMTFETPQTNNTDFGSTLPTLGWVSALFGAVNEAILEYAALHAVAHRYFDGPPEGTTAHLAEQNLRGYLPLIATILASISEVAVTELARSGQECLCRCPGCGLGICLCSPHGAILVGSAVQETFAAPSPALHRGIHLRAPRSGSPVQVAGLVEGDTLVAVDNREIAGESSGAIELLQETLGGHAPGEAVRLRVEQKDGRPREVLVTRT